MINYVDACRADADGNAEKHEKLYCAFYRESDNGRPDILVKYPASGARRSGKKAIQIIFKYGVAFYRKECMVKVEIKV